MSTAYQFDSFPRLFMDDELSARLSELDMRCKTCLSPTPDHPLYSRD